MSKPQKETCVSEEDPNLYFGTAEFILPNGDMYVGEYCAHRHGLIWREGKGKYITKDGQTYEGDWRDDKLIERTELVIKFPTGEEFHGSTVQDRYTGPGIYTMENTMDISCEFANNKPTGNIMLIDINGRVWGGKCSPKKFF